VSPTWVSIHHGGRADSHAIGSVSKATTFLYLRAFAGDCEWDEVQVRNNGGVSLYYFGGSGWGYSDHEGMALLVDRGTQYNAVH
jgi:hypothetical protein